MEKTDGDKSVIQHILERLSNILLINGGFLDNPGLYNGEMGLALFFARYADFTQNELYLEYCYSLIDKIQDKIHRETPIGFKQGLTGIGSTVEYLAQEGYIEADTDEVLEELDEQIFSAKNLSLLTIEEILDIGDYALWRISGNSIKKAFIIESYLPQLINMMEERGKNHKQERLIVSFLKDILCPESIFVLSNYTEDNPSAKCRLFCHNRLDMLNQTVYNRLLEQMKIDNFARINHTVLGIENGLAGLGLSLISKLDGDNYWTSLVSNILPVHYESLSV